MHVLIVFFLTTINKLILLRKDIEGYLLKFFFLGFFIFKLLF